jgi:hypothetical protein
MAGGAMLLKKLLAIRDLTRISRNLHSKLLFFIATRNEEECEKCNREKDFVHKEIKDEI